MRRSTAVLAVMLLVGPQLFADTAGAQGTRAACDVDRRLSVSGRIVLNAAEPSSGLRLERAATQLQPTALYRVTSAFFTRMNDLGIANAGENEILVFGADGRLERRVGRRGGGPEEFAQLYHARLNDRTQTIVAYDFGSQSVKEFALSGALLRFIRLQAQPGFPFYDVVPGEGSGFVALSTWTLGATAARTLRGVHRMNVPISAIDSTGQVARRIADTPGTERIVAGDGSAFAIFDQPFAHRPWIVVDSMGCVMHPSGDSSSVAIHAPDGRLIARIEVPFVHESLSDQEWERRIRRIAEHGHGSVDVQRPERRPSWSSGVYDGESRLWLERYHEPNEAVLGWWVADLRGRTATLVPAPPTAARLLAVTPTRAAVLVRDADDVEHVILFDIVQR